MANKPLNYIDSMNFGQGSSPINGANGSNYALSNNGYQSLGLTNYGQNYDYNNQQAALGFGGTASPSFDPNSFGQAPTMLDKINLGTQNTADSYDFGNFDFGGSNSIAERSRMGKVGDFMFGKKDAGSGEYGPAYGMQSLKALVGIGQLGVGMKQYSLAKKSFAEDKRQFNKNWGAQTASYNTQLKDRQTARVAADADAQSVESYMQQNGMN